MDPIEVVQSLDSKLTEVVSDFSTKARSSDHMASLPTADSVRCFNFNQPVHINRNLYHV